MNGFSRLARLVHQGAMTTATVAAVAGSASAASAQDIRDIDAQKPLTIKSQGSFFVGGRTFQTDARTGNPATNPNVGDITVDQMYVQYQVPQGAGKHVPVVMVHGCCLSSKTWETTPDGRMGWYEYFVRAGRATYLGDQSSRARSGFNATIYNEVRLGLQPPGAQPSITMGTYQFAWSIFRFGAAYGTPFPDQQFPMQYVEELYKQMIPDLNASLPVPNPSWANMATLGVKLGGAILMGHSESGFFPERAALVETSGLRGLISLEPGSCSSTTLTARDYALLARVPTIVVFGDHLEDVPGSNWGNALRDCQAFAARVNGAGGDATVLYLPDAGLKGNSHMFMQDLNNLEVAGLLLSWINQHVESKGRKKNK